MNIVVFGAGSLGSLIGGLLARTHDVTLVGRPAHMTAIDDTGLLISGDLETRVHPETTTDGTELRAHIALVTVKADDTKTAAASLATGEFDVVCSLQNGLTEPQLRAELDAPVLAGTTTYGARLREPGHVACTGIGTVTVGDDLERDGTTSRPDATAAAETVGHAFRAAGIETLVADDMAHRQWRKLAVNAAINSITALTRLPNGAVVEEPLWSVARAAARETAQVARRTGVSLSDEVAVTAVKSVCETTEANESSMLQDVAAGRETEIDAINGVVVERAETLGVDVPTNQLLHRLVSGIENDDEKSQPTAGSDLSTTR